MAERVIGGCAALIHPTSYLEHKLALEHLLRSNMLCSRWLYKRLFEHMPFFATTLKRPPATPCIGVCELGADGLCLGCARSADEISRWGSMSEVDRSRLMQEVLPLRQPLRGDP